MSQAGLLTVEVPDDAPRMRLDAWLRESVPELGSKAQAKRLCRAGRVAVDGRAAESSRFVVPGMVVTLDLPAPKVPVYERDLEVVWQDPHMAVVVKPAGLHTSGARARTLAAALPHVLGPSSAPDALPQPWPVHRLDRRTQGLVVVARAAEARAALGRAFEQRAVHKRYRAMVAGRLDGEGVVDLALEGRAARTRWRVHTTTPSLHVGTLTTVDCWPETGRMHQIRLHLRHLGASVLGDDLYPTGKVLRGQGLFLAAVELRLDHPITGEPLRVEVPEPAKFRAWRVRETRRHAAWLARS